MRLIDIDKHFELNEPFYRADIEMPLHRVKEALESLPTVQAIPVEWIKNYARHKASKGFYEIDCYWQFWEEDVLKMVTDWEKENERP